MSLIKVIFENWSKPSSDNIVLFLLKIVFMLITIAIGFFKDLRLDLANNVINITLFLTTRQFYLLGIALAIYTPAGGLIYLVSYLTRGFNTFILHNYIYGLNTFLSMLFLLATTSPATMSRVMDKIGIGLSVRLVNNILRELESSLDFKKARGLELKWSIRGNIIVLFDAVKILVRRSREIEVALKSRGLD
ncbi:hypothetical protein ACSU1N_04800 [Thermogladius sp. 4427co]|uniref:hypothetical protein n=1 Tax=Thermogladius sp. 4427co TaxID=3450718 RepID=UPI003F7989BF